MFSAFERDGELSRIARESFGLPCRAVPSQSRAAPPFDAFAPTTVDTDALLDDLREIRLELEASLGAADLAHLRKIVRLGRGATLLGTATAWMGPNLLSMTGLAVGRSTRWILMHHIGHRGYDHVPGVPAHFTSKVFARGRRRFIDWADWMIPEAWIYEHNVLHHSHTGEERDPDLLERNTAKLRDAPWPLPLKHAALASLAMGWRFYYYAPATLRAWKNRHAAKSQLDDKDIRVEEGHEKDLWLTCYLPFIALHFGLFPALFLPLGPLASLSALLNSIGAEVLANLHTFCVIGPNHTGEDLYRYTTRPASKGEATLRQIVGSANYATGTEPIDFAHLFLNYQIEHHIWPDLPMLKYREAAPKVKAVCAKHGIPYTQESVFARVKKMVDVCVGKASMKTVPGLRSPSRRAQPLSATVSAE